MNALLVLSSLSVSGVSSWSPHCLANFKDYKPSRKISSSKHSFLHDNHNPEEWEDEDLDVSSGTSSSRRSFLKSASLSIAGVLSSGPIAASLRFPRVVPASATSDGNNLANAMGLVTFPCPKGSLMNTYHIMRAGQSLLEEQNILSTNPLFLTNREDALTTLGVIQIEDACTDMMAKGINPSVVKYSLASKCIDTANIVATRMMIGRNRIIPEFTFMDPRGCGMWDGGPNEAAVWALDNAEAGVEGREGRPPPNDDGTANETLFEQMIRLRQLMSILETQYSGDSILLIFPDGTSPALLSSLIAGIPMKDVHALNFEPGEVRLDVNMDSTTELFKSKMASPKYNEMLEAGQNQLEFLRKEAIRRKAEEDAPPKPVVSKPSVSTKVETRRLELSDERNGIFPVGAMGAIAGMTMLRKEKVDEETEQIGTNTDSCPSLALASGFANSTDVFNLSDFGSTPVETRTYYKGSNIIEEVPVLSREERREAAEQAMEEYLNKDDGGDDWLRSMKDILDE